MFDKELVRSLLVQVGEWLIRIKNRSEEITTPDDFLDSEEGLTIFDSICMLFIAAGESLKRIDQITDGELFINYPEADWGGAMGFRDIIAHQYFQIDHVEVFSIIQDNLNPLLKSVEKAIEDMK
jgi:uncharacterized protein with HEPN domain